MKYVCLIYDDEKLMDAMPKDQSDAFLGEYFTFSEDLNKSGKYLAGEALQPVATATTLRMRNGKLPQLTARSLRPRNSSAVST